LNRLLLILDFSATYLTVVRTTWGFSTHFLHILYVLLLNGLKIILIVLNCKASRWFGHISFVNKNTILSLKSFSTLLSFKFINLHVLLEELLHNRLLFLFFNFLLLLLLNCLFFFTFSKLRNWAFLGRQVLYWIPFNRKFLFIWLILVDAYIAWWTFNMVSLDYFLYFFTVWSLQKFAARRLGNLLMLWRRLFKVYIIIRDIRV